MNKHTKHRPNPLRGFGVFLVALGIFLAAVTFDVFQWGSMGNYVRWEMLPLFIGLIMLFNGEFTGAVILLAVGAWFILPDIFHETPEIVRVGFWPAILVLAGLSFIIPSPNKWCRGKEF
jgi:hypothetical protein